MENISTTNFLTCISKVKEIEICIRENLDSISLLEGNAGLLLFYLNLYKYTDDSSFYLQSKNLIYKIIDNLNENDLDLASGVSGSLWVFKYALNKGFLELPADFFDNNIETQLKEFSIQNLYAKKFDFFYGGLSPCLYFFEMNSDNHFEYYKKLVRLLKKNSSSDSSGMFWEDTFFTKKDDLGKEINLGLAHGIPSIIYFLTKLNSFNIEKHQTTYLLINTLNWLKSKKNSNADASLFPSSIVKNESLVYSSRLAWCYGDLGIASVIWQAGKVLNDEKWKQEAISIMLNAANRRGLKENGVVDAGICHGTAGIAHIFNRFFWETRIPVFKETANYWIDETLKMANFNDGLAGFKSWRGREHGWVNEYGILEGVAGIALVLLGHITDEEPCWDRFLLLS